MVQGERYELGLKLPANLVGLGEVTGSGEPSSWVWDQSEGCEPLFTGVSGGPLGTSEIGGPWRCPWIRVKLVLGRWAGSGKGGLSSDTTKTFIFVQG